MSDITTPPTFEDIILNKLRKDIGEMMPEDALKSVVEKAMERIFFDPLKTPRSYGGFDVESYSWLEKECRALLKVRIEDAIKEYMKNNPDVVKKAIDDAIAGGIVEAMARALKSTMYQATAPLEQQFYKALNPG